MSRAAQSGEFNLVGLPDAAVKESISRIQAALRNSGYRWPGPKVTINLAPADVKKEGPAFDLPIALAAMIAGGELVSENDKHGSYLIVGELALDGRVRHIKGALATAMLARVAGQDGRHPAPQQRRARRPWSRASRSSAATSSTRPSAS